VVGGRREAAEAPVGRGGNRSMRKGMQEEEGETYFFNKPTYDNVDLCLTSQRRNCSGVVVS